MEVIISRNSNCGSFIQDVINENFDAEFKEFAVPNKLASAIVHPLMGELHEITFKAPDEEETTFLIEGCTKELAEKIKFQLSVSKKLNVKFGNLIESAPKQEVKKEILSEDDRLMNEFE